MEYLSLFSSSQVSLAHQPQYIGRSFRFHSLSMLEYVYIRIYIYMHVCIKQTTLKSLGDIESHYLSPLNSSVEALGNRMPHQWQLWSAVVSSQHQ